MAQAIHALSGIDAAAATEERRTVTLVVPAMHCGGCLRTVERALRTLPGVDAARVNLSARRVAVAFQPQRIGIPALIAALGAAGFEASELRAARTGAETDRDNDVLKRLAVAGFAAANVMLLSVSVWAGYAGDMSESVRALFHWVSALIALPAVGYSGQPFFRSAAGALRARRLNMDVPISLGVLLATGMSIFQTIRGTDQVYFDAAITLLFFLLVGRFLDQRMRTRAVGVAQNLLGLRAPMATVVLSDGTATVLAATELKPGMRVLVAAGERLPADGRVVSGASAIEESLITGETRPRDVASGAEVYAATLNLSGPIEIEVVSADDSTLVAEIARLMAAAEQGRGLYVRLADRAARVYAPAVHLLSLSTFLGWLALGYGWEPALTAAIAVLIITCPCALALAVPAVQVAATSRLLARGIIVKAPDALERLAEVDAVVLDKTGTLTLGRMSLERPDPDALAALPAAAALAAASRHPYAQAIVGAARARDIDIAPIAGVREVPGSGLVAGEGRTEQRLGSASWCGVPPCCAGAGGNDAVWFRRSPDDEPVALHFADTLRSDAAAAVADLRNGGYCVELLSGDAAAAVERTAQQAGIPDARAAQKPADKINRLQALKEAGRKVLMVGDGLNDAPALAAGHASLSPSTAADISQTAADVIFQGQGLSAIPETLATAKAAQRMALQNFAIAVGYNLVFVPLAAFGLVTPLIAAIAMSASSIAVTANAVRLTTMRVRIA